MDVDAAPVGPVGPAAAAAAQPRARPPLHAPAEDADELQPPPLSAPGAAAQAEDEAPAVGTFQAFRSANFRLLWVGDLFTSTATWMQLTTLSWLVYSLTGSGGILGAVNASRVLPTLLIMPLAGVVVDRVSRNRVVALSQLAQLVFTVALGLDLLLGIIQVWHLFVFTVLAGGAWAFNQPARQTLVFDVVPRRVVPNAVALSNVAFSFSRTFGSAGAGALLVAFGAATSFFLQGLANLTIMSTVLLMRLPAGRPAPAQRRSVLRELVDGYGYALRNPQARLLLLVMTINPLLLIPLHLALLPIFAAHVFASGAVGLGLMLGSIGAGGFLGGLLTASLNRVDRRGLLQLAALVVHSTAQAAFCLVGVLSGQLWLALPFLVVAGAAESVSQTTNQTVLQLLAPDHLRGRLTSALQVSVVIMPLGVLVAGSLADLFGAPAVGVGLSLTALATTLAILTFAPRLRRLRLSQLAQVKQLGLRA